MVQRRNKTLYDNSKSRGRYARRNSSRYFKTSRGRSRRISKKQIVWEYGNLNEISFNGWFWIRFNSQLIIFDWEDLPKGVHYTIAFNENSEDINFHITKNVEDEKGKPHIEIARINKKLFGKWLKEFVPLLPSLLLKYIVKPLNIIELKNKYGNKLDFIHFDGLMQSNLLEQVLVENFDGMYRKLKKDTKLRVKGDIERGFENFVTSKKVKAVVLNNMSNLKSVYKEVGVIVSRENIIPAIYTDNKWFSIEEKINTFELLKEFISPELLQLLNNKINKALEIIQEAKNCDDTALLNMSVRLKVNGQQIIEKTK